MIGNPQDYPLDEYSLDLGAVARLDGAVVYHRHGSNGKAFELPLTVSAVAATDMRGLRAEQRGDGHVEIAIRLTRRAPTKAFVISLLLIPLLLTAVLAQTTKSRKAESTETVVGAAAVLLALLPIRAVLVPSDIAGLTLVDYALAFEMALLAALVVWRETAA